MKVCIHALAFGVVLIFGLLSGCMKTQDTEGQAEGSDSEDGLPLVEGQTQAGLYYQATGSGEPLVLIHAFSLDHRMWDAQVEALAENYQVIRYDLRGHGRSAAYVDTFTAYDDLLSVYQALNLDSAVLVGLSSGAQLAIDFTLTYPDRVRQLVLTSSGLGGYVPEGSFDWMAPVMAALQEGNADAAMRAWVETPLMAIPDNPVADSLMREMAMSNAAIWTYSPALQQQMTPPAIDRLTTITVPTLVMTGALDSPDAHRVADILSTEIEGARAITIPRVGHLVNMAAPGVFEREVLAFLAATRP